MCFRPLELNRRRGFTYAEFIVAGAIAVVLSTVILSIYVSGERATSLSSAKLDRTAEARRALDWIIRDVREAVSWEMASSANAPSASHIKFRKVEDWDMVNNSTYLLSANYTEYTYNATENTIVRNLLDLSNNTIQEHHFYNITTAPFYMYDGGSLVALSTALGTNSTLVVRITSAAEYKPGELVNTTIESEVRLRNE